MDQSLVYHVIQQFGLDIKIKGVNIVSKLVM